MTNNSIKDLPQPLSNPQIMALKTKTIQDGSKYSTNLLNSKVVFNEANYAPFDSDAVRPPAIQSAGQLKDTALVHPLDRALIPKKQQVLEKINPLIIPKHIAEEQPDTLEHRVHQHSSAALPPQPDTAFVSNAASQRRPANSETQKIREAERKVALMRFSNDAIAHFAKTPDKAEVKLVFCRPNSYQTDNIYEPYQLEIVSKSETTQLPVYYTINQNGVMRILNEVAARKLNYQQLILQLRLQHYRETDSDKNIKIVYQKPVDEDLPESFLSKRPPELMNPLAITQDCQVLGAFMDDSTEFVQLDRWILESSTFNILRNFRFFREYYAKRAIDTWSDFRKYRIFCKNRAFIQFNGFFSKQHFLEQIMKIMKELINYRDTQAVDVYANIPTDDKNIAQQKAAQQSATPTSSEKTWIEAQDRLQKKIINMFDLGMDFIQQYLTDLTNMLKEKASDTVDADTANLPLFQKQKLLKTKSITQTKAEQLLKRKEIRTAQDETKQICKFICLSDSLLIESLLMMVNKSVDKLKSAILVPGACNGLIQSDLCFNDNEELQFTPQLDQIQKTIYQCIDDLISICNRAPLLYQNASFREYFELPTHWERRAQNFETIVNNDYDYQESLKAIKRHCQDQTIQLQKDAKDYEDLKPLWHFMRTYEKDQYINDNKNLTCLIKDLIPQKFWECLKQQPSYDQALKEEFEEALENARDSYGVRPLEREIQKFREWNTTLQQKHMMYRTGFACLEARGMIAKLQDIPNTGLQLVLDTGLQILKQTRTKTIDRIKTHIKVIQTQPQELEAFSEFIKYLEGVDVDMEILISNVQLCDDVLNLLVNQNQVQYNIPVDLFIQYGKPKVQDQDIFNADQKKNQSILGLGAKKIDPQIKTDMELLHNELANLTTRRNMAENFACEQFNIQMRNVQDKILGIKANFDQHKKQIDTGYSNDKDMSRAEETIFDVDDIIQNIKSEISSAQLIQKHAEVISLWYKQYAERKRVKDVKNTDLTVKQVVDLIQQMGDYNLKLDHKLSLWNKVLDYREFDSHVMNGPWKEIIDAGIKKEEELEDEKKTEQEKADEAEKKTDGADAEEKAEVKQEEKILDNPEAIRKDKQERLINDIRVRIKGYNAEKTVAYIADMFKEVSKLHRVTNGDETVGWFKQQVQRMRHNIQLMLDLGNPNLDDNHWTEIFNILDCPQYSIMQITFSQLLGSNAYTKRQEIAEISSKATGEYNLKNNVEKIKKTWLETTPKNKEHKSKFSSNLVNIIVQVDELYQQLDDSIASLQAMSGSRYIGQVKNLVKEWEGNLTKLQEIYDELIKCQQSWLYLESIFAPEDIRKQLPSETSSFEQINRFWVDLLIKIKNSKSVIDVVTDSKNFNNLYDTLVQYNADAEVIQKQLEQYLETKRQAFPRFYFISNDELLQILSKTTDASSVVPFLRKIFEAIADITIVQQNKQTLITEMISPEEEVVKFVQPIIPQGGLVENWLRALEAEMFQTMKAAMKGALLDAPEYGQQRGNWMFAHPAQTILAGGQCRFTDAVENALQEDFKGVGGTRKQMEHVRDVMLQQINELTQLIIKNPTAMQRKVITPLIVIEVFSRDICNMLLDASSDSYALLPSDFGWQKQLRTYWIISKQAEEQTDAPMDSSFILKNQNVNEYNIDFGDLIFRQTDFTFTSGYEYYGMGQRLVVTPLTAKAYITLTSAISKFYGGQAAGPAGTGKTETCKDLIKTLQVSCLIFNCSDGLDYKSMLKFFCGLAMTGSFSVFDEFNRILVDTLSVISQQILTIQLAVRAHVDHFAFDKYEQLPINTRVGFFITFNPDYEGRSALPENVKALFRPIAMIVPDYALIAENFLFSEGFKNGKVLSKKMTQLYKLSSEQLSQQPHYDFGMRAIKSILYMAGKLKAAASSDEDEDILLIRAMQDSNIPKFMAEDIILFNGIVQDLFPGIQIPMTNYGILEEEIKKILRQQGLQANSEFVTKILQSYDTHIIRHGQMFVGESLTGKSVARDTLVQAITNLAGQQPQFKPVEQYVLSAKAITMAELYGELNLFTNEWKDGLIAILARKIETIADKKIFLVFDSHVDPVWIENLNTVLDDSKMFCLTNGERIRLSEQSNVMFETRDLNQASPATVSRCGMVYFSNEFLGNENVFKSQTLESIQFVQKLVKLVCIEQFNIDYTQIQLKAKQLVENSNINAEDDEDETNKNENETEDQQSVDLIKKKLFQIKYPNYLHHYEFFEQVLYKLTKTLLIRMQLLFKSIVPSLLTFIRRQCQEEAPTLDFQQNQSIVKYLSALIDDRVAFSLNNLQQQQKTTKPKLNAEKTEDKKEEENETMVSQFLKQLPSMEELRDFNQTAFTVQPQVVLDQRFIFAIGWGVGGGLKQQCYQDFDKKLRSLISPERKDVVGDQLTAMMSLVKNTYPSQENTTIFDYQLQNSNRTFVPWTDKTKYFGSNTFDPNILRQGGSIYDMIIPTVQFVKHCTLLQLLLRSSNNIYLCGQTGTSKTIIVKTVFGRALNTTINDQNLTYTQESDLLDINTQEIPFSAQTKAETVENAVFEKLERKRKNTFYPAANRGAHAIFVDDADMPLLDRFGTQLPNELLRQLLYQEGCYDRQKLEFKQIKNVQMVMASQNPGAGRNLMNSRFTSKFVLLGTPELQKDAMVTIFGTILAGYFNSKQGYEENVKAAAYPSIYALVDLYASIRQEIRATPMKSHYTFNLRDVARVVGGIFNSNPLYTKRPGDLLQIFAHECHRVFRDRLIDENDENLFDSLLNNSFLRYYGALGDSQKRETETETEFEQQIINEIDPAQFGDLEQQQNKLNEIAGQGANISASQLVFGRWTNSIGVWNSDPSQIPAYLNLSAKQADVGNALSEVVNLIYDEQEQQKHDQDIDYELLLEDKEEIMNIRPVLFRDAIQHFSRMYRVLTQPAGHLLSIGLSGSGRKTLLKLVAATIEAEVEEPTSSRSYGVNELTETIKNCYLRSAQKDAKPIIIVFNESSLDSKDLFLEQINSILNCIPLPITAWKNEKEKVFEIARQISQQQNTANGITDAPNLSTQDLWDLFYRSARSNFHVCMFLSPVGENLRKRLRQFPALVNCTTIDWYKTWTNDALLEVANAYLQVIHPVLLNQSQPSIIASKMVDIHKSAAEFATLHYARTKTQVYVTPPMFMSFLQLFKSVLSKSVGQLKCRQQILTSGLNKLLDTQGKVSEMQTYLNNLQPQLQKAIIDTNELMSKLEKETQEVNIIREVVKKDEAVVAEKAREVEQAKAGADADLEEAKPAYQKAAKALESFDKSAVLELASFKSPPLPVKFTMEAVCVLFEQPKVDWDTALKLISQPTFVKSVLEFDKENIPLKTLAALRKYTTKPDFNVEKVGRASKAAQVLCAWAVAIDKYAEVFAVIKPKMILVEELTKQSNQQKAALKIKQDELAEIESKLQNLENQFKDSENKKQDLQQQVRQTELDLEAAKKLIDGLGNEHDSWKNQIAQIRQNLYASIGNAMIASAVIAYLGPYTSDQRAGYIYEWKSHIFSTKTEDVDLLTQIPVSQKFQLDTFDACADPRQIKNWKQQYNLPGDAGSIQSAIIVNQSKRYPFVIDPELQGINWLRKLEKRNNVQICGPSGTQLAQSLDNQISIGNPLIIENANEDLDPLLSSVLRKELIKKNNQLRIKVGDSDKEYNKDFKLFVTTRMRQPQFNPEIQAFSSVVNMAVSSKGLEEQLLSLVVQVENPTLETEKDQIISSLTDAKEKQGLLQDELLDLLAKSQDPLKDVKLINKLDESKEQAQTIKEQIQQGEIATQKVDEQRELFRAVAVRGRILYEAIAGLSVLDTMYTYSLDFFKNIYVSTLKKVEEGSEKEARMIAAVTDACFLAVQRGIFEKHKPTFAFMIAAGIQRNSLLIKSVQWRQFIGSFDKADISEQLQNTAFLSDKQKQQLAAFIETTDCAEEFLQIVSTPHFQKYCQTEQIECYLDNNPEPEVVKLLQKMTPFEILVLNKIINPTRILFYLPIFTHSVMQNQLYVAPPNFNITQTFQTASSTTPLIFIISTGSDPMLTIQNYVQEQKMTERFSTLALGQGQGVIAQRLLDRAVREGNWICLQNVHLCESWIPDLQKFVESLPHLGDQLHENFRLILTSMPSRFFPASILALSVKVANEPPRSVKQNIISSYQLLTEQMHDTLDEAPAYLKHWRRLLFAVGFFYATLLERKRFGAICYNSNYDFTVQDLKISQQFVRQYLIDTYAAQGGESFDQLTKQVPYKPLNFMIGAIAFGGRISDFLDSRCVSTIMSLILNSQLFEEKHQMCLQSDKYVAPEFSNGLENALKYIQESFPTIEQPSLFGLHENAELSYQRNESDNIIGFVMQMSPSESSGAGAMTVQQQDKKILEKLNDMIKDLPDLLRAEEIQMGFMIKLQNGSEMPSPYSSVLRQECQRYNKLLQRIKQLLSDCALAIQGMAIMSSELEQIYKGINTNILPQIIKNASYPSLKSLSSYFSNLRKRVSFFENWLKMKPSEDQSCDQITINEQSQNTEMDKKVLCQNKNFCPDNYWLGAFYFPHGFFTSILQHHARIYTLSIDQLFFETIVLTQEQLNSMILTQFDGVIISGLKSEGTRWDSSSSKLDEPVYGKVLDNLPSVWFKPVIQLEKEGKYATPLYTTTNRFGVLSTTGLSTNYVMNMHLPTEKPESWWILRGAAVFIQDTE